MRASWLARRRRAGAAVAAALVTAACTGPGTEETRTVEVLGPVALDEAYLPAADPLATDYFELGALAPGTHRSFVFAAPFTLDVPDDTPWQLLFGETRRSVFLLANRRPPEVLPADDRRQVSIYRPEVVFTNPFATIQDISASPTTVTTDAPDDLVGFLRSSPGADWSAPEQTTLGGRPAVTFSGTIQDLPAAAAETYICHQATTPCALVAGTENAVTFHRADRTYRYWVIDDGHQGAPVVVSVDARTAEFDDFLADASVLLDSLRFAP